MISGKGFRPNAAISINGRAVDNVPLTIGGQPEYSVQQKSTHQYNVIFPDPDVPLWDITLRQTTTQGQEEFTYLLSKPFAPRVTYDILRHTAARGRVPAHLDLRIGISDTLRIAAVGRLDSGLLTPLPFRSISAGEVFVTLPLRSANENDPILLVVEGDKGESAILTVVAPTAPSVRAIVNESTGKAEGPIDGGYAVLIRGTNLDQVDRVFFGNRPAQIQQSSPGVITVLVPKGEEGTVRVLLETNTYYQNKFLTNSEDFATSGKATFTYMKPKS